MYLQITTRCNMECGHCGFACTSQGEDMSIETFRNAIKYNECVVLGGGEPTVHPKFWEFIGYALGNSESIWLAINGKITDTAISLANMAKRGIIACDLSQDAYHEYIDPDVIVAFQKPKSKTYSYDSRDTDYRGYRDSSNNLVNAGRCDFGDEHKCICEGLICKPNGDVRACGCSDAPLLGNVNTDVIIPDGYEYGECHKTQELICN